MPLPIAGRGHEAAATRDFTWFVYGSSLDRDSFAKWAAEHGYATPSMRGARRARLPGYRLAFDVASRAWGGAVASLAESPGDVVEGLAVPMPGSARGLVDHREGALSGLYAAIEVTLQDVETGAAIPAVAYQAGRSRRLHGETPPAPAYLDTIIRGARASGLSEEWVHRLEALRSSSSAAGHP